MSTKRSELALICDVIVAVVGVVFNLYHNATVVGFTLGWLTVTAVLALLAARSGSEAPTRARR